MATISSIRDSVKRIVRNKQWTDDLILALINRGVEAIAAGIMAIYSDGTQVLTPPLQDLSTFSSLTTSTTSAYISLPTNFQRNLYSVVSATTSAQVNLHPNFADFLRYYPNLNLTCQVIAAVRQGGYLWYQGVPSTAESLTVYYYRKPTAATEGTAETATPDGLPPHLHEDLLVNYCCWKIWSEVESGVGAAKANTAEYRTLFNQALVDLCSFYPSQYDSVIFEMDNDTYA
jgi:hypothetical protein